jgi:hypothetical protein
VSDPHRCLTASIEAKLSQDLAKCAALQLALLKHKRQLHVAKVFHLRSENAKGAGLVETYMKKHYRVECIENQKLDSIRTEVPSSAIY